MPHHALKFMKKLWNHENPVILGAFVSALAKTN